MIKTIKVCLSSIDKVKRFSAIIFQFTTVDIVAKQEDFLVDGKSIIGLFSLNLLAPIDLEISGDGATVDAVIVAIREFIDKRQ